MAEFIVGDSLSKLAREYRFLQRLLWRLDYALVWSLTSLFRLLPIDAASRLGARVGAWIGPRMERKHAIYRQNLASAFPHLDATELNQLLSRAWGQAGRVLAEYAHLGAILADPERLEIDIREPIVTYTEPDKPCVMVAAHHNNWEVIGSAMAKLGIPNASLYSPPTNPYIDRLLAHNRRALKQGRTAAMVMDRRVDEGKPVQFFGRDKVSTTMPAKLALKFQCPLVPVQVQRMKDARYRVIFHKPLQPQDATADQDSQALDLTQQAHAQFEDWIRAEPEGWFCSKRLWAKVKLNQSEDAGATTGVDNYAA
jgi:KDO2-lipid IV(A) lauroyltransferase